MSDRTQNTNRSRDAAARAKEASDESRKAMDEAHDAANRARHEERRLFQEVHTDLVKAWAAGKDADEVVETLCGAMSGYQIDNLVSQLYHLGISPQYANEQSAPQPPPSNAGAAGGAYAFGNDPGPTRHK